MLILGQFAPFTVLKQDVTTLPNISLSAPLMTLRKNLVEKSKVSSGVNLSVTEMRQAARHPVDFPVIAEHQKHGDVDMHIANLSAQGFMIDDAKDLGRGDRVIIRLPIVGRIEAYVIWISKERAGFQFERILRLDDFMAIIDDLQPNPRLRRPR